MVQLVTGHTTVTIGVVYRCPNITKQNNNKIHNAISEVSTGDCIIMGNFNHGNIKWDSLQSTGVEDQRFLCLVQDNFLTQHVLEPTRAARVLDIVLSSQKEFVDNVVIQEPLGSSDHNQLHFNINLKSDKTKVKQCRRDFRKGNYKQIRKSLARIDWNDKMKNKTATECWNILRGELDSAIDSYVPMKKQGKRSKKKHLSKEALRKIRYKQNMWQVYKHTEKDKDDDAYKESNEKIQNAIREVSKGDCIIMGDFNHGNIQWDTLESTGVEDQQFMCLIQDNFIIQHVLEPTRGGRVLDLVLSSQKEFVDNVKIQEPLGSSDHNQLHFNIKIKSDKTKVSRCKRNFRKGNYKEMRTILEHIDWNDKMKNKTGAESWNILKSELDSVINRYVPMKKQGKWSKKKHLSKEAFKKIRYKQDMWRVYKHTGKDKDYEVYKEALNAATNEVRKSKRNFEHKLAQNIKSDSKSFYAYVRSKQNVRDKVRPLEDNAGNIITEGVLMAEELNMHFSSVFTREDTSSLPVPETKFNGTEGDRLGQLDITPEVVANKINNMKDNKSPGVDGIAPKILKETVEQISKPLAHVFNMSLQEGIVPFEWKEANIIPLFKKGSRNKSVNYRPVSNISHL